VHAARRKELGTSPGQAAGLGEGAQYKNLAVPGWDLKTTDTQLTRRTPRAGESLAAVSRSDRRSLCFQAGPSTSLAQDPVVASRRRRRILPGEQLGSQAAASAAQDCSNLDVHRYADAFAPASLVPSAVPPTPSSSVPAAGAV